MTMRHYRIGLVTIGLATVLGCAGKSLNDVGDLDTGGAGEGGAGDGSGASAGTAGATGGGSGGTNGGGTGAGSGGTNGGGTSGGAAGGTDGAGRDIGPCNEGDGCLFEDGTGIRALAADATHLYWVEYGTTDELGNYANDGRLLSRAFDSTDVTTLATDLAGSVGVAVTTTHVYAFVDWFWQDGGERYAIVRVPLAGGELQTVHVDLTPRTYGKCAFSGKCFYAYDDAGYWYRTDGVYEITAASDAAVRIADEPLELIGVDESHLFYIVDPGSPRVPVELWKIPRSDGDAGLVTNDAKNARHSLSGEYIYALAGTLFRMPKAGGRWTALAQLFANPGYELSITGDDFYFDAHPGEWSLTRGSLSNPEAADVIIHLPSEPEGWVGTPAGAYWTDGSAIYFRAID